MKLIILFFLISIFLYFICKYQKNNIEKFNSCNFKLTNQNNSYLWEPYKPFSIQWTLTGNKDSVEETNNNIVLLEEKRNKRIGFAKFLKFNFLKFYK